MTKTSSLLPLPSKSMGTMGPNSMLIVETQASAVTALDLGGIDAVEVGVESLRRRSLLRRRARGGTVGSLRPLPPGSVKVSVVSSTTIVQSTSKRQLMSGAATDVMLSDTAGAATGAVLVRNRRCRHLRRHGYKRGQQQR